MFATLREVYDAAKKDGPQGSDAGEEVVKLYKEQGLSDSMMLYMLAHLWHQHRYANVPHPENKVQNLELLLRDGKGNLVEKKVYPVADAMAKIANFVQLHGTDPDENGAAAQPGTITFWPQG